MLITVGSPHTVNGYVVRIMSTISGIAANKTDKNKAKFKTIDINNVYKGTSVGPSRTTGN